MFLPPDYGNRLPIFGLAVNKKRVKCKEISEAWRAPRFCLGKLVYNPHYLATIFAHKYDEVMIATQDWRQAGQYRLLYGTFRADVIRRMAEKRPRGERILAVESSLRLFDEILEDPIDEPETAWIGKQFLKAVREVIYIGGGGDILDGESEERLLAALSIIEKRGFLGANEEWRRVEMRAQLSAIEIEGNPFVLGQDDEIERHIDQSLRAEALEEGFSELVVTNIPNTGYPFPNFLFGRAESGEDYFCHFSVFEGDWEDWRKVKVGERIMIVPGTPTRGKASPPAQRIRICYG